MRANLTVAEKENAGVIAEENKHPPVRRLPVSGNQETLSFGAPRSEVAFEVNNLCCWFGQHQAVHDLSLQIPARAVTAIIGPSGCGKSTFLRSLNRMHELVRGSRLERTNPSVRRRHLRAAN